MNNLTNVNGNQTINKGNYDMNLPAIQENADLQQAVSARELHNFLSGGERFSKWFERMCSYGFEENFDYVGCTDWYAPANQELQDYFLSVDMAKEISMLQRSDKGRQARQYFIECERKVKKAAVALPDFFDPVAAARAFANEYEAKRIAQEQLAIAAPKISHYDRVVDRNTLLTATQVGQKVGISAVKLNRVLDELGVYNKAHKRSRAFKQWFVDKGLGEMKQTDMGHSQALFSLRGEAWIIEKLASESVA